MSFLLPLWRSHQGERKHKQRGEENLAALFKKQRNEKSGKEKWLSLES